MRKICAPLNWGADIPFQVPEEDFLPERPGKLTEEWLLEHEIDPPEWAVRASCKLGGRRHEKRMVVPVRSRGTAIPFEDTDEEVHGVDVNPAHPPLPFWPGKPNKDIEGIYNRAIEKRRHRGQGNQTSVRDQVPKGSLREDDYRFWKGFVTSPVTGMAQCRWCGRLVANQKELVEHHDVKFCKTLCKERLSSLYSFAKHSSKQRHCFVCLKPITGKGRWGIPMCRTVHCISRWKFQFVEGLKGLRHYMDLAEEEQRKNPTEGPFSHLPDEYAGMGTSC